MIRKTLIFFIAALLLLSFCACAVEMDETYGENASYTAIAALSDTGEYYGSTFGQGGIIDIYINISEKDWTDICENARDEEYHIADITVNGTTLPNVGFRTKGGSSLNAVADSDSDRYGFKIKTDEYIDGQTLNGLDMFVLNGFFSDPSYMREYLTYSASQYLGCITPFLSYANLYINGELFGFYLCIEAYDDSFSKRYSGVSDTVLYKAVTEYCTLLMDDDCSGFDVDYGKDEDCSNIKNLIEVLNKTTGDNKDELEAILDIDSVLKAIAINTVMGNYDSYNGPKAHNYYLLYSGRKFTYIGWDYNMSIAAFTRDGGLSISVDIDAPVFSIDILQRPLINKLLAISEYKQRYLAYIEQVIEYFSDFESMVSDIADAIQDCVAEDPTAFYTIDEFFRSITASDTDLLRTGNQPAQNTRRTGGAARPTDAGKQKNGNRGLSINEETVSIVDYILQRIAAIKD